MFRERKDRRLQMLRGFKNTWDDAVAVIDLQRLFLYNKQRIEDEYKIET